MGGCRGEQQFLLFRFRKITKNENVWFWPVSHIKGATEICMVDGV
jgi:hypothetical protein